MPDSLLRSAACGLAFCAGLVVAPALAGSDATTIADLVAASFAASDKATVSYESATSDGDSVTITDFKLTATGEANVLAIPALVITGVTERESGGFAATRMAFDNGTATGRGDTVTWTTASADDVIVPSADEVKDRARLRLFRTLSIAGANVSGGDVAAPIDAATVTVEVGDIVDGAPSDVRLRATGVKLPTALFANSVASAVIGMLNYTEFVADISMDGAYDTKADTVTVRVLTVDIPDVGKITLAGKASGFSLRGITDPDADEAKAARANAKLDTFSLRLDNAGFVERMLDMQAGMLGGTRDDVRAQLVDGALPFALSFVENESFRTEFQAAVATFLADPRSLTITVAPGTPLPLGQVIRTAARSPMALPDLLAPTVEANK